MLAQVQDRAIQRIAELKEQNQRDHAARIDVENNYRTLLEDKSEMIKVLMTQVVQVTHDAFILYARTKYSACCDRLFLGLSRVARYSSGCGVGLTTRWLRVQFSAAAASTVMGDHLWMGTPSQYIPKPPRPTQPPALSGTGNDYRPKCGDALWLGSKGRIVHSIHVCG